MMTEIVSLTRRGTNVASTMQPQRLAVPSDEAGDATNLGQQQDVWKLSLLDAPMSWNGAMEAGWSRSLKCTPSEVPVPLPLTLTVPRIEIPASAFSTKYDPMLDYSIALDCDQIAMQDPLPNAAAHSGHMVPESWSAPNQDDPGPSPSPELSFASSPSVPTTVPTSQLKYEYPLILRRLSLEGLSPHLTSSMYTTQPEVTFPLNSNGTCPLPRPIAVLALPADPRFRDDNPGASSAHGVLSNPTSPGNVLPDPTTIAPRSHNLPAGANHSFVSKFCSYPALTTPTRLRQGLPGYSVIQPIPVSPLTSDALLIATHRQSNASPIASSPFSDQYASRACLGVNGCDPSAPILLDDDHAYAGDHNGSALHVSRSHYLQNARHHPVDREIAAPSTALGYRNCSPHSHGSPPVILPDNRRLSPGCIPAEKRVKFGRIGENRSYGPRPVMPRPCQNTGINPGESVGPHLIATIQTLEARLHHADTELQRLKALEEQYFRASIQRPVHNDSFAEFMQDTTDVVLMGSDESRVCAHKAVLMGKSQYFRARFDHQNEKNSREAVQTNFQRQILEAFVTFFYTAAVDSRILDMYAAELLCAAETYRVEHLKSICENAMMRSISQDNVLELFELACVSRSANLKEAVLDAVAPRGMAGICELGNYEAYATKNPQLLLELYKVLGSYGSRTI